MATTMTARQPYLRSKKQDLGNLYIVFLIPDANLPGGIRESDPVPFDPATGQGIPPSGAPDGFLILGWYTFRASHPKGTRIDRSPTCYIGGKRIRRREYLQNYGELGPLENRGGSEWVIQLPNGAVMAYNKGDRHYPRR